MLDNAMGSSEGGKRHGVDVDAVNRLRVGNVISGGVSDRETGPTLVDAWLRKGKIHSL